MKNFKSFFSEKTVVGLIEHMTLHGVGELDVKIDSGNGGVNALDAQDITIQGDTVLFTTFGKQLSKKIVDHITINVGAGNTEDRPVVTFRITFGGQDFDNVPFSLSNRASNDYKILVGKEFITQLDALIDINSNHIADQSIEIDL